MIYTLTINPALDHILTVNEVKDGATNRALTEQLRVGGKGINVSRMLSLLGVPTTALVLTAGGTGRLLAEKLKKEGFPCEFFVSQAGATRINTKLRTACGEVTEINAPGPTPSEECLCALRTRLARLTAGDVLLLAGNPYATAPAALYPSLVQCLPAGVRFLADTSGAHLGALLPLGPLAVKPNRDELAEFAGHALPDEAAVRAAAKRLQAAGASWVLVTLGADGLLLLSPEGHTVRLAAHPIRPINTVGAGDAALAGLLFGLSHSPRAAAELALATSAAVTAAEEYPTRADIATLLSPATRTHFFGEM